MNGSGLVRPNPPGPPAVQDKPRGNQVANGAMRKPSTAKKVASAFIAEDVENIKTWMIFDVLIPQIKNMILGSIEMMFFGTTSRRIGSSSANNTERTNYTSYYRYGGSQPSSSNRREERRQPNDFRDIGFVDRQAAEDAICELLTRARDYGEIYVADFKDAAKQSSEPPDWNWGWTRETVERDGAFRAVRVNDPEYPWRIEAPRVTLMKGDR